MGIKKCNYTVVLSAWYNQLKRQDYIVSCYALQCWKYVRSIKQDNIMWFFPFCLNSQLASSGQYSGMHLFGTIYFFWKYEMANYSAHFHEKFIVKKSIIFVKFKKQSFMCAHEFSWFTRKVVCTTYIVPGFFCLSCRMTKMFIRLYCTDPGDLPLITCHQKIENTWYNACWVC